MKITPSLPMSGPNNITMLKLCAAYKLAGFWPNSCDDFTKWSFVTHADVMKFSVSKIYFSLPVALADQSPPPPSSHSSALIVSHYQKQLEPAVPLIGWRRGRLPFSGARRLAARRPGSGAPVRSGRPGRGVACERSGHRPSEE